MLGLKRKNAVNVAGTAALKKLRANVMMADPDLNIIYMNDSVLALMHEAEADLKRELPRFSVETLIGSNIDVFHKNPAHQRRMLGNLTAPHAATIQLGKWTLDLLVTPLFDGGKRLGYAVEWDNAEARLLERLQPDWKIVGVRRAALACCLQSICISSELSAHIRRFQSG